MEYQHVGTFRANLNVIIIFIEIQTNILLIISYHKKNFTDIRKSAYEAIQETPAFSIYPCSVFHLDVPENCFKDTGMNNEEQPISQGRIEII